MLKSCLIYHTKYQNSTIGFEKTYSKLYVICKLYFCTCQFDTITGEQYKLELWNLIWDKLTYVKGGLSFQQTNWYAFWDLRLLKKWMWGTWYSGMSHSTAYFTHVAYLLVFVAASSSKISLFIYHSTWCHTRRLILESL